MNEVLEVNESAEEILRSKKLVKVLIAAGGRERNTVSMSAVVQECGTCTKKKGERFVDSFNGSRLGVDCTIAEEKSVFGVPYLNKITFHLQTALY